MNLLYVGRSILSNFGVVLYWDESNIVYGIYRLQKKAWIKEGEEMKEFNLASSFKSGGTSIGVVAAITYGSRSPLICVRK